MLCTIYKSSGMEWLVSLMKDEFPLSQPQERDQKQPHQTTNLEIPQNFIP